MLVGEVVEGRRIHQQVDLEMAYWLDFEVG